MVDKARLTESELLSEFALEQSARLRAAWEEGLASFHQDGPQLETDDAFEAFLDECEASAQP